MAKIAKYRPTGFQILSEVVGGIGLRRYLAANVSIAEGDVLHDNGSGYATNAVTAMANTFLGVAAATVDNSGGSAGDLSIDVYPRDTACQFAVAVENNAVITQTAVGTIVDLESVNTIDISDTTIAAGPGFMIDEIDASADAVAANTFGFAIGHWTYAS
jgi:hypothetical protein